MCADEAAPPLRLAVHVCEAEDVHETPGARHRPLPAGRNLSTRCGG